MTASFSLALTAPIVERRPKTDVVHGDTRVNDYFWLREKGAVDVTVYLETENDRGDAAVAPTTRSRNSARPVLRP